RAAVLGVLVLDLVFGSLFLGGDAAHPDRESVRDRELARFLGARSVPYRANLDDRLDPPTIYRYAISVVDGGSTFAPSRFLDLYFLSEEYPRILDLLNVQYLVRLPKKRPAEPEGALRLPPGAFQRIALPSPRPGRLLELDSYLIGGREVPDGAVVAAIRAIDVTGASHEWPIRAGRETAEWTMDRAGGTVTHAKPPVARSWAMPDEAFAGHSYRASFPISPGFRMA